ncbi:MAG TPA: hypothetical protein VIQ24_18385 [Pyrinomonadaceae bacterium]
MTQDQTTPLRVDHRRLIENLEHALDQPDTAVGLGGGEAEASPGHSPASC